MSSLKRSEQTLISASTVSTEAADFLHRVHDFTAGSKDYQPFEWPTDVTSGMTVVIGPSGAGKSQLARRCPGVYEMNLPPDDDFRSVIDTMGIENGASFLHAAGLSSIPQWAKLPAELSNGEHSRYRLAATLYGLTYAGCPLMVDEFTSTVDRTVAYALCTSLTKFLVRTPDFLVDRHLILVSCHHDILDWLEPTAVIDVGTGEVRAGDSQARGLAQWHISVDGQEIKLWN